MIKAGPDRAVRGLLLHFMLNPVRDSTHIGLHIQQKPFTFVIHGVQNCSNFSVKIVTARLNMSDSRLSTVTPSALAISTRVSRLGFPSPPLDLPNKIDALLCFLSQIF